MLKKLLLIGLAIVAALVLLALPGAIRWLTFYEGSLAPREIPRPSLSDVVVPTPEMPEFADRTQPAPAGTVLVDLAHENNFQMSELSVLESRLAARGQRLEAVRSGDDLPRQLRYARALIAISPQEDWTPAEIQQVQDFVQKGGRVLLVADATRYKFVYDEWGDFVGLDHDAAHINDLASRWGLIFQPDYLYDTTDNAGNFRNIRLTRFAAAPLTRGLKQLVFYGARSILSQEPALIQTGGTTRSSNSERSDALAVAVLTAHGQVLALADLTFMAEPQNAVADNDRFIANLADFLTGAQRQYELADFPHFFGDQVDLVYASDPHLDSDLLAGGGSLQAQFTETGRQLTLRKDEDKTHDTLFVGLYGQPDEVRPYLSDAQVTLWITPTQATDGQDVSSPQASKGSSDSEEGPAEMQARIEIQPLGTMVITGTSLFILETMPERRVLVVLADTEDGLEAALQRLDEGDLADCVLSATEAPTQTLLALCPTGEVKPGEGKGGWKEPEEERPAPAGETGPAATAGKKILVVALDDGKGRYDSLTGADEFASILEDAYRVTVWSQKEKGTPSLEECSEYNLVIFASGDYEGTFADEESDLLFAVMAEGVPVILSGGYLVDTDNQSVQRDLEVRDASHPLARGFVEREVIAFEPPPSGSEYEINVLSADVSESVAVPFVRGPDSEDSGAPAVRALKDRESDILLVLIGFPIYLLPDEAQSRLVENSVAWLLAP